MVFRNEMIHESRVIPLDGPARPVVNSHVQGTRADTGTATHLSLKRQTSTTRCHRFQWAGYPGDPGYHSLALRVTERFRRIATTCCSIKPRGRSQTWVKPWTLQLRWRAERIHTCSNTPATKAITPCAISERRAHRDK